MSKQLISTITIILVIILVIILIFISKDKTSIITQIQPNQNLFKYKNAYIDVQHDEYSSIDEKRNGRNVLFIDGEIRLKLKKMGFNTFCFDQIKSIPDTTDILVNCHITDGLGIPKVTRHFRIEFQFTKTIDIDFIDAKEKTLIAKISYVRGFSDSPDGIVDKIFTEFKKKLGLIK